MLARGGGPGEMRCPLFRERSGGARQAGQALEPLGKPPRTRPVGRPAPKAPFLPLPLLWTPSDRPTAAPRLSKCRTPPVESPTNGAHLLLLHDRPLENLASSSTDTSKSVLTLLQWVGGTPLSCDPPYTWPPPFQRESQGFPEGHHLTFFLL